MKYTIERDGGIEVTFLPPALAVHAALRRRYRGFSARCMWRASCVRARANRAFTVPWGNPKTWAVSKIERPSTTRS